MPDLCLTPDCTMAQCRDLETHHHEKLLEICINTLEKMLKGELDADLPDDVRAVSVVGGAGAWSGRWLCKADTTAFAAWSADEIG